jgi:hypothetical protein
MPGQYACPSSQCRNTFRTAGGLQRHRREKHGLGHRWFSNNFTPHDGGIDELRCPIQLCERGKPGHGFGRPYRLTQHLMNANTNRFPGQGHGMTKIEAQRMIAASQQQEDVEVSNRRSRHEEMIKYKAERRRQHRPITISQIMQDMRLDESEKNELVVQVQEDKDILCLTDKEYVPSCVETYEFIGPYRNPLFLFRKLKMYGHVETDGVIGLYKSFRPNLPLPDNCVTSAF